MSDVEWSSDDEKVTYVRLRCGCVVKKDYYLNNKWLFRDLLIELECGCQIYESFYHLHEKIYKDDKDYYDCGCEIPVLAEENRNKFDDVKHDIMYENAKLYKEKLNYQFQLTLPNNNSELYGTDSIFAAPKYDNLIQMLAKVKIKPLKNLKSISYVNDDKEDIFNLKNNNIKSGEELLLNYFFDHLKNSVHKPINIETNKRFKTENEHFSSINQRSKRSKV